MLDWAGGLFRWVCGAVVPMFVRPVPPVPLAWFAHVLLVLLALVGSYLLFTHTGGAAEVQGAEGLKGYWLTALLLLLYLLAWAAAVLWEALAPSKPEAAFPDLDDAWAGARAALDKHGIGLADTPMYLVLGELPSGFEPFFRAMPGGLTVAGGNPSNAPLQVFANRDAIYLTVPGATLLGAQAATEIVELMGVPAGESVNMVASIGIGRSVMVAGFGSIAHHGSIGGSVGMGSVGMSIGGAAPDQELQRILKLAREQGRPLTDDERRRMKELSGSPQPGRRPAPAPGPAREPSADGNVLQNAYLVAQASARVAHLCNLIAAARYPLCPVNGAIVAVPVTALSQDVAAQQWGLVAKHDLTALEQALKLRFPVFTVVGGVETLPGGGTFFEKFAADKFDRRLGKGFPFNPDVRPDQVGPAAEKVAEWVLSDLLPYSALKLTRVSGNAATDTAENASLVRFLDAVRRRGAHLGRLVSRAVGDAAQVPVYGGAYLSVVLPSNPHEAAFAKEFFRKVEASQGYVAWTPDAYAAEASYRRMALIGNLFALLLVLAVLALGGYVAWVKFGKPAG